MDAREKFLRLTPNGRAVMASVLLALGVPTNDEKAEAG